MPSTDYEPYEEDYEEDLGLEFERTSTLIDDILTNDGNIFLEISGNNMMKKKGKEFVEYEIHGKDSIGSIDIKRRYSEFLLLRDMMYARYPGLMIPPMPIKQFQGNTKNEFLESR